MSTTTGINSISSIFGNQPLQVSLQITPSGGNTMNYDLGDILDAAQSKETGQNTEGSNNSDLVALLLRLIQQLVGGSEDDDGGGSGSSIPSAQPASYSGSGASGSSSSAAPASYSTNAGDSGPSSGAGTFSPEQKERAARLGQRLQKDFNLTPAQAAGVIGNMMQESQLKTGAVGDGGNAYGLAQWNGGRMNALKSWCSNNGYDYKSEDGQYAYLKHELQTSESGAIDAVKRTSHARDAAVAFEQVFERAGVPYMSNRIAWAEAAEGFLA